MKTVAGTAILLVTLSPASAGYVGSVVGLTDDGQASSLIVNTGQSLNGAVVLDGSTGTRADFAMFRLVFSVTGLEYSPGWYDWSSPFTTGGSDDFSSPGHASSGVIDVNTFHDPFAPDEIDVVFENLTDQFGQTFSMGSILSFTLTVPLDFAIGSFTIAFASDTFANGTNQVQASVGSILTVNVVPTPSAGMAVCVAGLAFGRRRR